MNDSTDKIAAWASIIGSAVALLGLLQAQSGIVCLGLCCLAIAVAAVTYARQDRRKLRLAGLEVEGINLDSLNLANLRRRLNHSLIVQEAYHLAKIESRNLTVAWKYDGFCGPKVVSSLDFSIDSEANIAFERLDCFAHDLREDPRRLHQIRPLLIGADGLSKKISIPFLKSLNPQQPFSLLLHCVLPDCLGEGVNYYTSSLSFAQRHVERLAVHLVFVASAPDWVRVYDCGRTSKPHLVAELRSFKNDGETCEYVDIVDRAPGQSIRLYVYRMSSPKTLGTGADMKRINS